MNKEEKAFVEDTLRREGWPKVTNRPSDRGGLTKGGITRKGLEEFLKRKVTDDEIRNLSIETAAACFAFQYLAPYNWIPDTPIRTFCADFAVMAWHDDVAQILQRAAGVTVDGIVGPQTKEKVLLLIKLDRKTFFRKLFEARQKDHFDNAFDSAVNKFIEDHPETQLRNIRGWINRMCEWI
jgi:lysozyme family protein